jgi:hypothetical protein
VHVDDLHAIISISLSDEVATQAVLQGAWQQVGFSLILYAKHHHMPYICQQQSLMAMVYGSHVRGWP